MTAEQIFEFAKSIGKEDQLPDEFLGLPTDHVIDWAFSLTNPTASSPVQRATRGLMATYSFDESGGLIPEETILVPALQHVERDTDPLSSKIVKWEPQYADPRRLVETIKRWEMTEEPLSAPRYIDPDGEPRPPVSLYDPPNGLGEKIEELQQGHYEVIYPEPMPGGWPSPVLANDGKSYSKSMHRGRWIWTPLSQ